MQLKSTAWLFLDTLHYSGITTALDSTWATLPVVTLATQEWVSRAAMSVATAVGHLEPVVTSHRNHATFATAVMTVIGST